MVRGVLRRKMDLSIPSAGLHFTKPLGKDLFCQLIKYALQSLTVAP